MPSSRASSWPRDWTCGSCLAGDFLPLAPPRKPFIEYRINVNITFTLGTKKFMWLALVWYLLYCSALEQNLQYLQDTPGLEVPISLSWSDYTVMGTRETSYQNGWCLSDRKLGTCFPNHLNLRGKKWPLEALSGVAGNENRTKCMSSREHSFCRPFPSEGPGRSATLASR